MATLADSNALKVARLHEDEHRAMVLGISLVLGTVVIVCFAVRCLKMHARQHRRPMPNEGRARMLDAVQMRRRGEEQAAELQAQTDLTLTDRDEESAPARGGRMHLGSMTF